MLLEIEIYSTKKMKKSIFSFWIFLFNMIW
jgi:hypothetical protein